jgi:hypothetical protein
LLRNNISRSVKYQKEKRLILVGVPVLSICSIHLFNYAPHMKTYREWGVYLHVFLTLAIDADE